MTDAERLMLGFVPSLRESPFRIAPERADKLLAQMGGEAWVLEIVDGPANFEAFPAIREIEGTYNTLFSRDHVLYLHYLLAVDNFEGQLTLDHRCYSRERVGWKTGNGCFFLSLCVQFFGRDFPNT